MRAALALGLLALAVSAHAQPVPDEAGVRAALERCVAAWNRHVPKAFADACVTDDVWFTEVDDSWYQRYKGRAKMLGLIDYSVRNTDLQWQVMRLWALPDGSVAVQLKQRTGVLPRKQGKYAQGFDSDPSLARLRRDGGRWKVFFLTSHAGWARAEILKLDAPPAAAATPPMAPAAAATGTPRAIASPLGDPPEYARAWGRGVRSCGSCHGRPPALPHSDPKSRIVAVGAAARDGAALRKAMSRPELGDAMSYVLADPQLSDVVLDGIRRYLLVVRDGELPEALALPPGATQTLQFRNRRHDRDPPVAIVELAASAGWMIDSTSQCRVALALRGQQACTLVVQRLSGTAKDGELRIRLGDTPGLQPQARRVRLQAAP